MRVLMIVGDLEDRGVAYTHSLPQQPRDICHANHGTIVHMGISVVNIPQYHFLTVGFSVQGIPI
jgi:hypothetical protein